MKISGNVGFGPQEISWPLWPQNGFAALDRYVASNPNLARGVDDDGVAYWFMDSNGPDPVTFPDVAAYHTGIRFFGTGFVFDENYETISGTITGVEIIKYRPHTGHGHDQRILIEDLDWKVADINRDPASFWAKLFDGNDQVVLDQSPFDADVLLGDGDDHLVLQNVMDRHGEKAYINMGAGDDYVEIKDEISASGDLMPKNVTLGEGFDDLVIGSYHPTPSFIDDFNPDEDQITFLNLDKDATIVDNGGEGVTIANFHISEISEEDVKLENGVLTGINGRDYSRNVNDADVTQHLHGTTNKDVFVLDGKRDDYRWHATDDGKGIVIWDVATKTPDLLYNFEVLRFNDVTLSLDEWPRFDGVQDIAGETQYVQAEEWGESFIIDGKMSDYEWAPTRDKSATVVWNRHTGQHDIIKDFGWIAFNDANADLVQYPRSNAPTTIDQADVEEILVAGNHRQVFEIDGYRDDYSWGPNPDGEGIAIWNSDLTDILVGFDGVRFRDSYVDLEAEPQGGDIPRPETELVTIDDPNETQYLRGENGDEVFRIDGAMSDYSWSATQDKQGVVIWNDKGFDILMNFEAVQFEDGRITTDEMRGLGQSYDGGVQVRDVAAVTQYLHGEGEKDQFIIDGVAAEYSWSATQDGSGFVVWDRDSGVHDILTGFEEVVFLDQTVMIDEVMG